MSTVVSKAPSLGDDVDSMVFVLKGCSETQRTVRMLDLLRTKDGRSWLVDWLAANSLFHQPRGINTTHDTTPFERADRLSSIIIIIQLIHCPVTSYINES